MAFRDLLSKKECTEAQYKLHKEQFDNAIRSGLITVPQKFEKAKITSGLGVNITYAYKWELIKA